MLCLINNASVVVMSSFNPELFMKLIEKYKPTYLPIVPPIMTLLAKSPLVEKYDFRSVTEILCAAAPLSKKVSRSFSVAKLIVPSLSFPLLDPFAFSSNCHRKKSYWKLSAEVSPRCAVTTKGSSEGSRGNLGSQIRVFRKILN